MSASGLARPQAEGPVDSPDPRSLEGLVRQVLELTGEPIDALGVAATLESRGLRDLDAVDRYGRRDMFDLADVVYQRCLEAGQVDARTPAGSPSLVTHGTGSAKHPSVRLRTYLLQYLRGCFSFLPLVLQVVFLLTLGYSQWGWIHFSREQASVVALGAVLSLVGTGPFTQLLGYLGPYFSIRGKHILARRVVLRILASGIGATVTLAGLVAAVNLATSAYPWSSLKVAVVYDVLISLLWLVNGSLYVLKRYDVMVVGIASALLVVGVVLHHTTLGIYAAHWLGLATAILLELGVIVVLLTRRARATRGDMRLARLPRPLILLGLGSPFALYGACYFLLLLTDRVVAWSAGSHPLPIWFSPSYELGLDFALFGAAVGMAFLEVSVHAFGKAALPRQGTFSALEVKRHNHYYGSFFARQIAVASILAVAGLAALTLLMATLHGVGALGSLSGYYGDAVTRRVFVLAAIGYLLLTIGMGSCSFLFSLSRPWLAVRAIMLGAIADLAVGLPLSRAVGFSYAAGGLVAGGLVFAVVSTWYASQILGRADFHCYAAY